jgi:hypothetical protein
MGGYKIANHPISILTISFHFQKIRTKQILKVDQKYPHLLCSKFVNEDTFSLLLKLSCSITFGDIDITTVLRCGHNRK